MKAAARHGNNNTGREFEAETFELDGCFEEPGKGDGGCWVRIWGDSCAGVQAEELLSRDERCKWRGPGGVVGSSNYRCFQENPAGRDDGPLVGNRGRVKQRPTRARKQWSSDREESRKDAMEVPCRIRDCGKAAVK